jgi:hypothetical protein
MISPGSLEEIIEGLDKLDLAGLRDNWRRHLRVPPPPLRSRDLLRRTLAFELQSALHGGLTPELKQRLRATSTSRTRKPALQPGTTLTRDWHGARHVVHVRDGSFEHLGTTYRSLSEVARVITGTRWSGPRFFGLGGAEAKASA